MRPQALKFQNKEDDPCCQEGKNHVDGISEYNRRQAANRQIPDKPASRCGCQRKNQYAEQIHSLFDRCHGTGNCKSNGSNQIHYQNKIFCHQPAAPVNPYPRNICSKNSYFQPLRNPIPHKASKIIRTTPKFSVPVIKSIRNSRGQAQNNPTPVMNFKNPHASLTAIPIRPKKIKRNNIPSRITALTSFPVQSFYPPE